MRTVAFNVLISAPIGALEVKLALIGNYDRPTKRQNGS